MLFYEMEIALRQLPSRTGVQSDQYTPPWLVDRLFRDLLVDLTGNTHRAEICIDKLYSPDTAAGRLGLVELRGFEMPPHARMSLAQQLLIRAVVAAFWNQPYDQPLCHWQSALHDRFMLPHYAWRDLRDVINQLQRFGIDLDPAWYLPHYEFRFPHIGEASYGDVTMRLRSAIEPWYVLGEEPGGSGTARYVDSSVERIELLVDGLEKTRFRVLCNGINVPLHATGIHGQYVAGIRFRAWQPPRCLHPTIAVHCPLRFEVVDLANRMSIGGCTYHVAHPGGRGTDRFPINANEAEARRAARFETFGMSSGQVQIRDLPGSGIDPFFRSRWICGEAEAVAHPCRSSSFPPCRPSSFPRSAWERTVLQAPPAFHANGRRSLRDSAFPVRDWERGKRGSEASVGARQA